MPDLQNYWWIPVLAALIAFWTISALRSRAAADHLAAIAALCDKHGMARVEDAGGQFIPQMLQVSEPRSRYAFANGDWSLWLSEISDPKAGNVFAVMMFSVAGLNIPYVEVARKGAVDLSPGSRGQSVQLESIDFADRFEIRSDDSRAAIMLVDQGMMQWLLDLDQVSFQITGPLVTGVVKQRRTAKPPLADVELLFSFQDSFAAHVPQLTFNEYPAPKELAAATIQAMRMIPNLLASTDVSRQH